MHYRQSVMAGRYQQHGPPLAGHSDPRFMFHDSEHMVMDSRMHLPPDHLSNTAFWYRPDTSLPVAERQEIVHLSHGLPGAEAVKHRRTRSGCFTCRSRRVKVGNTINHRSLHLSGANYALSVMRPDRCARVSYPSFRKSCKKH
jgi:hypothetical protein